MIVIPESRLIILKGLLILRWIISEILLFLIRIQLLQKGLLTTHITVNLVELVLLINLVELFSVASDHSAASDLDGIALFLDLTIASLHVTYLIVSSLLKALDTGQWSSSGGAVWN